MSQTPEQAVNRVIDRLKDILDKGNMDEKNQLEELLEADNIYGALSLVEDMMQERFDLAWNEGDEEIAESQPAILKFPEKIAKKKKMVKG
jgi:hypothetical protein